AEIVIGQPVGVRLAASGLFAASALLALLRSPQTKGPLPGAFRYATASFAALTGLARTILRAGLALNIISSPLNGLVPFRALVAGFLITTNFAKPGTRKTPLFLSSL